MAAPPARARADYDYLIKLLLIGDSGWCPLDLYASASTHAMFRASERVFLFVGSWLDWARRRSGSRKYLSFLLSVTLWSFFACFVSHFGVRRRGKCLLVLNSFCFLFESYCYHYT